MMMEGSGRVFNHLSRHIGVVIPSCDTVSLVNGISGITTFPSVTIAALSSQLQSRRAFYHVSSRLVREVGYECVSKVRRYSDTSNAKSLQ